MRTKTNTTKQRTIRTKRTPKRVFVTRAIKSTGRGKQYKPNESNPWSKIVDPIINHKSFTDDQKRKYEFVDEKIADEHSLIPKQFWGKWGQIIVKCTTDDTYWRIGFLELDKRDGSTVPDPISVNDDHSLVFVQYDYPNRKVVVPNKNESR